MVYVKKWADFHAQSAELAKHSPEKTRYLIKATPSQQWLVLKVTDDQTCIKFRARSAIIINRFESFTRDMTALMAGLAMPSVTGAAAQAMNIDPDAKAAGTTPATNTTTKTAGTEAASGGAGAGAKKKKKKGKK